MKMFPADASPGATYPAEKVQDLLLRVQSSHETWPFPKEVSQEPVLFRRSVRTAQATHLRRSRAKGLKE